MMQLVGTDLWECDRCHSQIKSPVDRSNRPCYICLRTPPESSDRKPAKVKMPGLLARSIKLTKAYLKWKAAGYPVRSPERVAEVFTKHCQPCPHFEPQADKPDEGRCGLCTCPLSKHIGVRNKIEWATESCVLPEPLWVAEVTVPDTEQTA